MLVGIALYNPASATTISRTSSTLFIGGVSFARTAARGEVYAELTLHAQRDLWIMCFLLDVGSKSPQAAVSSICLAVIGSERWRSGIDPVLEIPITRLINAGTSLEQYLY